MASDGVAVAEEQDGESVSLKGSTATDRVSTPAESMSSFFWASVGWWIVVIMSVPFALYAAVFVRGNFEQYKEMSVSYVLGRYDVAGLNILHHLRGWQIHSLAAEAFLFTAPFQFSPTFRERYPARHRQLGYVFVVATAVLIVSAVTVLIPNSDFAIVGKVAFSVVAIVETMFLGLAVTAARQKKFKVHQRFMIPSAALGYSVMVVRALPSLLSKVFGLSLFWSLELGAVLAPLLFLGLAEIYIQTYLS